jgi:L-2-hydroxycarboxylate dehydrogenase (NAD+)
MKGYREIAVPALREFCVRVFCALDVSAKDAGLTADVLINADQRGIASHGVQRLERYVKGLRNGSVKPKADIKIIKETPNTLLISGGDGLGQVISFNSMQMVIAKALQNNVALAAVRDSNHYGIAGYYAMMALEHGLIGVSLTNAISNMAPTFGKERLLGTNPIAIAIPSGKERPIVLDMATSTVPFGKVEIYQREGKKMPLTWALDRNGDACDDPSRVIYDKNHTKFGGLLPLGGAGEEGGGHKGYGLALVVDLLCGVLSESQFGPNLYATGNSGIPSSKVSHFLGAIKIDAFIDLGTFKNIVDSYITLIKNSAKSKGHKRIFIHGEKEFECYEKQKNRVWILKSVIEELNGIGRELGLDVCL